MWLQSTLLCVKLLIRYGKLTVISLSRCHRILFYALQQCDIMVATKATMGIFVGFRNRLTFWSSSWSSLLRLQRTVQSNSSYKTAKQTLHRQFYALFVLIATFNDCIRCRQSRTKCQEQQCLGLWCVEGGGTPMSKFILRFTKISGHRCRGWRGPNPEPPGQQRLCSFIDFWDCVEKADKQTRVQTNATHAACVITTC